MLERKLEALGHSSHQLGDSGLLPHAEDAVVRALGVVKIVALVTVESFFENHVHGHVEMGLVALLATDLGESVGKGLESNVFI